MFNYLEILGSQNLPIKADLSPFIPHSPRRWMPFAEKAVADTGVGGTATFKNKRRFKAVLILWKHWLSMAC